MEATIAAFRGSRRRKRGNQMIVLVDNISSKEEAQKYIGKKIVWRSPGKKKKEIKGIIAATHGRKGALRARFEKGLPGQAIGTKAEILE